MIRKRAKIERLEQAAERAQAQAEAAAGAADQISGMIPLGQPILVGHHSEARHRRAVDRIYNLTQKAVDAQEQAVELRRRAEAAENNAAIFTDDPDALAKLQEKLAKMEALQERMKQANKLVRKSDRDGLRAMGFHEDVIESMFTPDWGGDVGIPKWKLSNNAAEIRRLKKRIATLESHASDQSSETTMGSVRIVDNVEENRVQLFFSGKPDDKIRDDLKSHGFRWAPSVGAWQRHRSNQAMYHARRIGADVEAMGEE